MITFKEWMADDNADELVAVLEARKELCVRALEDPDVVDPQRFLTRLQGTADSLKVIQNMIAEARNRGQEDEGRDS